MQLAHSAGSPSLVQERNPSHFYDTRWGSRSTTRPELITLATDGRWCASPSPSLVWDHVPFGWEVERHCHGPQGTTREPKQALWHEDGVAGVHWMHGSDSLRESTLVAVAPSPRHRSCPESLRRGCGRGTWTLWACPARESYGCVAHRCSIARAAMFPTLIAPG